MPHWWDVHNSQITRLRDEVYLRTIQWSMNNISIIKQIVTYSKLNPWMQIIGSSKLSQMKYNPYILSNPIVMPNN